MVDDYDPADDDFAALLERALAMPDAPPGALADGPCGETDSDIATFHPVLEATAWIVVLINKKTGQIVGANHYTELVGVFDALDAAIQGERAEIHAATPLSEADFETTVRYTAPARRLFTVAHIVDEDAPPEHGASIDGFTVCRLPMHYDDLWVAVPADQAHPVCERCTNPHVEAEQGGLWE
jgi:hypothetical protein